jgi:excisionase family DNA binding protein
MRALSEDLLPPLLTMEEACKVLRINKSSGYKAAREGELPCIRFGRRVYVPSAELLALVGIKVNEEIAV